MSAVLNHRSVMFPLKYMHCVKFLYIPSLDLLSFNSLFSFLRRTPELKDLMGRAMWTEHFLLMNSHPTYILRKSFKWVLPFLIIATFFIVKMHFIPFQTNKNSSSLQMCRGPANMYKPVLTYPIFGTHSSFWICSMLFQTNRWHLMMILQPYIWKPIGIHTCLH